MSVRGPRSNMSVVIATSQPPFSRPRTLAGRDLDPVEHDLVELAVAAHLAQRPHLEARARHVHEEVGEPLVLSGRRVGAGQDRAPVREVSEGRPHLAAGDDVGVAPPLGPRLEGGQVAAGIRLGEALAEHVLRRQDTRQVQALLLLGAVHDDGGTRHVEADRVGELGGPRPRHLLVEDGLLHHGGAAAAVGDRPVQPHVARRVELPLPVDEGASLLVPAQGQPHLAPVPGAVDLEPGPQLVAECLLLGGQPEVHLSASADARTCRPGPRTGAASRSSSAASCGSPGDFRRDLLYGGADATRMSRLAHASSAHCAQGVRPRSSPAPSASHGELCRGRRAATGHSAGERLSWCFSMR